MADEPRIVEAVGTAGASGTKGLASKEMEQAMAAAVQQAYDAGMTDPEELRRVQLEARARVKAEWAAREAEAASQQTT
jgi:hypothetical protein